MCFGRLNDIRAIYGLFAKLVPNANTAAAKILGFPLSMKIYVQGFRGGDEFGEIITGFFVKIFKETIFLVVEPE